MAIIIIHEEVTWAVEWDARAQMPFGTFSIADLAEALKNGEAVVHRRTKYVGRPQATEMSDIVVAEFRQFWDGEEDEDQ